MAKIINEDNTFVCFLLLGAVVFLIFFYCGMKYYLAPKYKKAYTEESKYVYVITIDDKEYIVDSHQSDLEIRKHGYYGSAGRISFTLPDGTFVHSSNYKVKKVLKEDFSDSDDSESSSMDDFNDISDALEELTTECN